MATRFALTLATLILLAPTAALAEITQERINTCLNDGLSSILTATNVDQYAVIQNIAMNVAGPAWKKLSQSGQKSLQSVILATMVSRLSERGREFIGAVAVAKNIKISPKYPDQYTISGELIADGVLYWFQTIAYITKKHCMFYTLNIENVFILSSWLKDQPLVLAKLDELGIRQ